MRRFVIKEKMKKNVSLIVCSYNDCQNFRIFLLVGKKNMIYPKVLKYWDT